MTGRSFDVAIQGLDEAITRLGQVAAIEPTDLADMAGHLVVLQTQERIRSEKTAPDGGAWKPNRAGTSILYASGLLEESIHHQVADNVATIGSSLVYARIHNDGGVITPKKGKALRFPVGGKRGRRGGNDQKTRAKVVMPKRTFLGLSPANRQVIETKLAEFIGGKLQ